jgi:glycosyltransferase involved in cell wall biosynthesis
VNASPSLDIVVPVRSTGPDGGAERSVLEVTEQLSRRGHSIHLVYRRPGEFLDEYRRFCASTTRVPQAGGAALEPVSSLAASVLAPLWTRAVPSGAVSYLNALLDVPTAFVRSGPAVLHLREPPRDRHSTAWSLLLRRVPRLIAVSRMVADSVVDRFGLWADRVEVIHNGVDPDRYRPAGDGERPSARRALGLASDDVVVLYAGRLSATKGIDVLMHAIARLRPGRVRLLVAGGPDAFRPASKSVRFLDRLRSIAPPNTAFVDARAENQALFHAADVVAVPSTWTEPFSRVVLESMACGVPVLASSRGGTPEAYEGLERWLFDPDDVPRLSALIDEVVEMGEVRRRALGARFRRHVAERFRLEHTVDRVESVLRATALESA